jgi:hypothetical protein
MNTFIIRNNPSFVSYVKHNWKYFLKNNKDDVKITIRKNSVFIHINAYYCVICNDLVGLQRNSRLETNKKGLDWLKVYSNI